MADKVSYSMCISMRRASECSSQFQLLLMTTKQLYPCMFSYTMVGILLSGTQLNQEEFSSTSIESLIRWSCPDDRRNCITGNKSLGTFFEINGLGIAYPSLDHPRPANRTFYRGGYITSHYAARINVIQTELSYVVRNEFDYSDYIQRYVRALLNFMKVNRLMDDSCQP